MNIWRFNFTGLMVWHL